MTMSTLLICESVLGNNYDVWVNQKITIFLMLQWEASMGSRFCELVGLYLLSHLTQIILTKQAALYRDDGLEIV